MEPVARRTRRRTEEDLLKRYREYKKAKTCSEQRRDQAVVPTASPPTSQGSSTSSASASASSSASSLASGSSATGSDDPDFVTEEHEDNESSSRGEEEEEESGRKHYSASVLKKLMSSGSTKCPIILDDDDDDDDDDGGGGGGGEDDGASGSSGYVVENHVINVKDEEQEEEEDDDDDENEEEEERDGDDENKDDHYTGSSGYVEENHVINLEDEGEEEDDHDEKNGGGTVVQKLIIQQPTNRGNRRALTTGEIHRVLFNSILEEASTDVSEEPAKPHEAEDTKPRFSSSDVDSGSEMDSKDPEQEEIDSMYRMADFYLLYGDNDAAAACLVDEDTVTSQEELCREGKHYLILDEEIGVICKTCGHVREEIKYVTAPFHENCFGVSERSQYYLYDHRDPKNLPHFEDPNIDFQHSKEEANFDPTGTVWEIIPDIRKTLYPHQREAFEFIWRNVGGGTKLNELLSHNMSNGSGCLISHAPGTGKTRLAIAFLETHMKFYKNSRPVILAPASILLTWRKEFERWKVDVPFLNLNDKELSEKELSIAGSLFGRNYEKNLTSMARRLIKLLFWKKHESVLAISYTLFTQLAGGEDVKKRGRTKKGGQTSNSSFLDQSEKLRLMLLETPGLLILDEGHMPRNERSCMFNVLSKVKTKKKIILSGTPFQNNFRELHNILCLVREEFTEMNNPFKSSVDKADEGKIKEFKEKIRPFYHRYDGYIVSAMVPGLIDNVIYLQPSDLQNQLLKDEKEHTRSHLEANVNMTLISVHPMLLHCKDTNPDFTQELKSGRWDVADGAKTRFLIRLIELSSALEEKVLVFSQFLHPLKFVKALLQSKDYFGWREGIEILLMSGSQEMETRKRTMDFFNKSRSQAKVMLASTKACSEGIELTGASRVVLLDVTWNPSVEKQAISRAYRIGQQKVVHVYHLIMTDSDSNRHISQTQKNNFSKYVFSSSNKKNDAVGSLKPPCEDIILERLLEEKIIKEAIQRKAYDAGLHNGL